MKVAGGTLVSMSNKIKSLRFLNNFGGSTKVENLGNRPTVKKKKKKGANDWKYKVKICKSKKDMVDSTMKNASAAS